jgi:POT family proton-dependent oligopeptide transporter
MLANLFSVELWERFSFYGMQIVVLLYMYFAVAEGGLGIDQDVAVGIIGAYGGLVYLSTIMGAWVADRLLGSERVLFYSGGMIMAGHIALAVVPGTAGVAVGLLLVGVGSGGLKANVTSLVGTLYAEGDDRRDAGFSIFYMGINIGALLGPLLTGVLQQEAGFHWGFAAAAVGMAIGLVQYALTRKNLPEETHHVANPLPADRRVAYVVGAVVALALVGVLVWVDVITADRLSDIVIGISLVAAIAYFARILSDKDVHGVERSRILAFIPLFVCNVVFWSLYQQQFTVVTLYADKRLDRDLFGWEMPISWVNSINPVFIIVLAGVFAALWTKLGDRQPVTPIKFGAGTALMGVAFFCFLLMPPGENTVPLLGLAGILLLFTVAELLISPVGLSATTKLGPKKYLTQMVALYFLSVALGTAMAGTLAGYYDEAAETPFFVSIGLASVITGVVVMLASKPIHKLMAGVD